jgi:hypothetical protein
MLIKISPTKTGGKLEYHVPAAFDETRPGFIYTLAKYGTSIADHPVASRLPQAIDHPSLFGSPEEFRPFIRSPDVPDRLEGWLYSDNPQLAIHVITFEDATLVTVTFVHTLMDAMGLASLFQAWTAVLRGKQDEVPLFVGFNHDPLASLSKATLQQRYVFADNLLKGSRFFLFALRYLFDLLWYRKDEERVIFLPAKYLQLMRDNAMEELASQNTGDRRPFVSESDVLLSWWTRVVLRALKPATNRTIALMNIFDCRSILEELGHMPSAGSALIANATFPTYTFLSVRHVLEEPLSFVASQIRQSLEQQRNKEQLQAFAAIYKTTIEKAGHPPVFGNSSVLMIACSNWGKSRLFQVDFSPAVLASGIPLSQRVNQLGRPSYVNATGATNGFSTRNAGPVIGKDAAGNWWLAFTLRSEIWIAVDQQLRLMSKEENIN